MEFSNLQDASVGEELASLIKHSGVRNVRASRAMDGRSATVSFVFAGQHYSFNMKASSIYADGATVLIHTNGSVQQREVGTPHTFSAREEGRRSTARLNEDGSVTGLFEIQGELLQVVPLGKRAELLEGPVHQSSPHRFQVVDLSKKSDSTGGSLLQRDPVYIDVDDDGEGGSIPHTHSKMDMNSWTGT